MKSPKALKIGVYKVQIRVYYEDTDAGGIVYHANYIKYCERARSEVFFANNVPLEEGGAFFVVRDIKASFLKSARLGDMLHVSTSVVEFKNASLTLKQDIFKGDELLFSANIRVAYVKNAKPCKIPLHVKELLDLI